MEGCELQKFQDWLLEGLVATLIERNIDGNLVSNIFYLLQHAKQLAEMGGKNHTEMKIKSQN